MNSPQMNSPQYFYFERDVYCTLLQGQYVVVDARFKDYVG